MYDTVADLPASPVEKPHTSMSADQAVFHCISAWTNVFPSSQILAVEKLSPLVGISCASIAIFIGGKTGCSKTKEQEYGDHYAFQHRNLLKASLLS
jgi:hypothetical protein